MDLCLSRGERHEEGKVEGMGSLGILLKIVKATGCYS